MWRLTGAGLGLAKSAGIHCRLLRLSQAVNLSPQSEEASNSATVTPAIFSERYKSVELIRKECRRVLARAEEGNSQSVGRVLNMLKLCAGPYIMEAPAEKVKLAEEIWKGLMEKGPESEVYAYNILLRVYNMNGHTFSPSEFLEQMKEKNVTPNMGTFTLLIHAYCNQGNIGGASKLLEYMRSMDLPLSEAIYASLVTGHSRAGDIEAAEEVISIMKASGHVPHNVVYTSLLCAHAERGNIEAITKLYQQMREERLFPSMTAYTEVMNTLSKHGHGSLVPTVLALIKNKEWLSSDLRTLACSCLFRGELEVPRLLIKELVTNNGLDRFLVIQYIITSLQKQLPLHQILEDLREDVDLSLFSHLYEGVVNKLVHLHLPVVAVERSTPPKPGDLAPHPLGDTWSNSLLQLYELVYAQEHNVSPHYYYPLLARYCSDVNMDGFAKCWNQMLLFSVAPTPLSDHYLETIESNAATTIEDYIKAEVTQHSPESDEGRTAVLFGILQCCNSGKFLAAHQLLLGKLFETSKLLSENSIALSNAIRNGCLQTGYSDYLVDLFKSLHKLRHPPDLKQCVAFCCYSHAKHDKPLKSIVNFLMSLEHAGLELVSSKTYLFLLANCDRQDKEIFLSIYKKLMLQKLRPKDHVTVFKAATKIGAFGLAKNIYQSLPQQFADDGVVRSHYAVCLALPSTLPAAVKLIDTMIEEGQIPGFWVWSRIVLIALRISPETGEQLLKKMKSCGFKPNRNFRHRVLKIYVEQGNFEGAKDEMDAIVSEDCETLETYELMAEILAQRGEVEEIKRLLEAIKSKFKAANEVMLPYLINAHLKKQNIDEVLSLLAEKQPSSLPEDTLALMVLEFVRAKRDLSPVMAALEASTLGATAIKTLLFFSYIDCGNTEQAATLLQEMEQLDQQLFKEHMSHSNAASYLQVLKEGTYHLKDMNSAYLMKSGYVMNNDTEGLKALGESLKENGRTDWLWTLL